jgi:hypothetical protein
MALKGTLKDFPITDIFQLADQQGKSGVLQLRNKKNEVRVLFDEGRVVGAVSTAGANREPIGAMLVRSGLILPGQLETALQTQKQTLRKLGDTLIEHRAIAREDLKKFLELQTQDTIFRIFMWRAGEYEFLSEPPEYDRELATPMSAQHLVMDSVRMVDEWPAVRRTIVGLDAVPGRAPGAQVDTSGAAGDDDEDDIDAAFSDWGDEPSSGKAGGGSGATKLTRSQGRVWDLIDGNRTIQEIVDQALLGEFTAAKAIAELVDSGVAQILGQRRGSSQGRLSTLPQNKSERVIGTVWGLAGSAGLVGLAAAALFVVNLGSMSHVVQTRTAQGPGRTVDGLLRQARVHHSIRAQETYLLLHGRYARDDQELAKAGLIRAQDYAHELSTPEAPPATQDLP